MAKYQRALLAGLCILLALGTALYYTQQGKSAAEEPVMLSEVTVCIASDLHYIAPELTDGGEYFTNMIRSSDGKAMMYSEEITDAFVEAIIAQKPDVLILSGDLTFNGAEASHRKLAQKLQEIEDAGVPVLVIPGNHDLNSSMAASFQGNSYTFVESIDRDEFANIYRHFGYDSAIGRDSASLSYIAEVTDGLRVLMVDVNTKDAPGTLTDETLRWAEEQLKAAQKAGAAVLAVSHQNVLVHNSLFTSGYVMGSAEKLEALYEKYGVLCNLSGHMHIQHIAQNDAGLTEICTSALPVSPCQYGVLKISAEGMDYRAEQLQFAHSEEAKQLMHDTSYRSAEEDLEEPTEEKCELFARVNMAYFSGRTDELEWDETLYSEILKQPSMLSLYLQSVHDGGAQNQTEWQKTF